MPPSSRRGTLCRCPGRAQGPPLHLQSWTSLEKELFPKHSTVCAPTHTSSSSLTAARRLWQIQGLPRLFSSGRKPGNAPDGSRFLLSKFQAPMNRRLRYGLGLLSNCLRLGTPGWRLSSPYRAGPHRRRPSSWRRFHHRAVDLALERCLAHHPIRRHWRRRRTIGWWRRIGRLVPRRKILRFEPKMLHHLRRGIVIRRPVYPRSESEVRRGSGRHESAKGHG